VLCHNVAKILGHSPKNHQKRVGTSFALCVFMNRQLAVSHTTRYTYAQPVNRSAHRIHLRPMSDQRQKLLEHSLQVSPTVDLIQYEDAFGNSTARFELNQPYTEFTVSAKSLVEIKDVDPFAFATIPIRPQFPLMWLPGERLMLTPYLLPVELPETQLMEITDYAMGFVERNNHDLMETLFAMNLTIHRDYLYSPGSTTVDTTPYDVFVKKAGVCQDFTNLFACMARLLGVPARYVCGYLHTGNAGQNKVGCDASHAWIELYIPNVGWKGFDPTNGTLPHLDHVRVAHGRHYRDVAPIAGTVYTPSYETINVDVEVLDVTEPAPASEDRAPVKEPAIIA
jgi:transglutaminase-like putative cysteine protease